MHAFAGATAFVILTLCSAIAPLPALAQGFPARPVRIVVPYPPAGTSDLLARLLGKHLAQIWGQPVVVENRAGGGGTIGTERVTRANSDGHTILLAAPGPTTINPHLMERLPYDPLKDLDPVTLIMTTPSLMVVNPATPAKTVAEFVKAAKSAQGKFNFASTGNGSPSHLMGIALQRAAGAKLEHIAYKGTAAAITDLLGGRVQVMFNTVPAILATVKAGRVRALAITSPQRFEGLPDVPTMKESGFAGIESIGWYGLLVPAGTPTAVIGKIQADVAATLRNSEVSDTLRREGSDVVGSSPSEFREFIARDYDKLGQLIRAANLRGN